MKLKIRATPGASMVVLALCLLGCTNLTDPANRAAADGAIGASIGTLIGGAATGGGIGIPIGFGAGAAVGAIAGAISPPTLVPAHPTFPW